MADDKHTEGPLHVIKSRYGWFINAAPSDSGYADCICPVPTGEANARRLVACWNALEGVPTEFLEGGVTAELKNNRGTCITIEGPATGGDT